VKKNPEAGFALLFVYAMAATVAIMLLKQLPSAAFEAQRDREQLLIDRGEQYTRGVQLYVRKFNRYPPDFDALDNTQNQRFLRHRYEDPLTGKEEWRIIHVGPGGVFTDSLVYNKPKDPNAPVTEKQTFITEIPTMVDPNAATAGVNVATRRGTGNGTYNPNDPNSPLPGTPVQVLPGQQNFPGQTQPLPGQSGQLTDPNQSQQALPGGLPPGVQFPPGTQPPPGFQIPGQAGAAPNTGAANLINQLLTTPRPGGLGGLPGVNGPQPSNGQPSVDAFGRPVTQTGTQGGLIAPQPGQTATSLQPAAGQTIGGGIAGVASKVDQEGIKIYRDRKVYKEWEFVYDITKDVSRAGGVVPPGAGSVANPNGAANPAGTASTLGAGSTSATTSATTGTVGTIGTVGTTGGAPSGNMGLPPLIPVTPGLPPNVPPSVPPDVPPAYPPGLPPGFPSSGMPPVVPVPPATPPFQ
jgi:hypothetical protein